jgi:aspartyl-tRNA(Asn)/glutamyl-tRNA(Gln) amidotransferase subunit B
MIASEWVERVRADMAELPRVMAARFVADYGLSDYDATQLTQSRDVAAYFEAATKACGQPKLVGNWIMGEISRRLNAQEADIAACPVSPAQLAALIGRIQDGTISNNAARQVLDTLWDDVQAKVDEIIEIKGLKQMNDTGALEKIVDSVLAANPKNVEEYRAGNSKALNALVGQIMKGSQGKANPQQVNEILRNKLG